MNMRVVNYHYRINASYFGYAGTKDRRGKSAQEVTVYRYVLGKYYKICIFLKFE